MAVIQVHSFTVILTVLTHISLVYLQPDELLKSCCWCKIL